MSERKNETIEVKKRKRRTAAEIEADSAKKVKIKAQKEQMKKSEKALLHQFVKETFLKQINKGRNGIINGFSTYMGKNDFLIVIYNDQLNQAIIKVMEPGWREGYWFYCFNTDKFEKFDKEIHKTGYGNDKILWRNFN